MHLVIVKNSLTKRLHPTEFNTKNQLIDFKVIREKKLPAFLQDIAILNVNTGGIAYDGATF